MDGDAHNVTIISLQNLRSKNRASTPKKLSTIARDLLNHCFIYFVMGKAPRITISDETETISINNLFDNIRKEDISTVEFSIEDKAFRLIHFKNYNPNSSIHCLNMCANDRRVSSTNLQSIFNGVNSKFINAQGAFVYNGYITSEYLNENVNRERTSFNISDTESSIFAKVTKNEIITKAVELALDYLRDELVAYNNSKREKIEHFVRNVNPRYRLLLRRYPECIDNILIFNDEDKMELELFKQEQQYKLKLKEEGKELEKIIKTNVNADNIVKKTTEYAEKLSEMGKSSLAEYILHRKAVLDLLERNLKYQDNNQYAYEQSIHQIVFPMQQTSDDIDYTAHNLWLIDEKLSYHYYLASDKKIKSMDPIQSDSKNEPDITIFDSPFAFTDENEQPFRNITIIEFKRPGREAYGDSENPIQQVIEYMDDFTNGKIKTKDGLTIDGTSNIRFFCYIICDISEKLHKYIKQYDFQLTPDLQGYYLYSKSYNAYMEIIPYNKMIKDSKKRNKILFDKLFDQ